MRALALSLTLLAAFPAAAQQPDAAEGDVISAHDGRGNVCSVYNQYDGRSQSIVVTRSVPGGSQQWSISHYDGNLEKAYSAVMDNDSALYVVGQRRWNDRKGFLTLKFDQWGRLEWESYDDWSSCSAVTVAVDTDNNALVAGVCRDGENSYPARIVKYSAQGSQVWAQNYEGGGRNYVRSLQVDYRGDVSMVVETVFGGYSQGSFNVSTVVFDKWGRQVEVRR